MNETFSIPAIPNEFKKWYLDEESALRRRAAQELRKTAVQGLASILFPEGTIGETYLGDIQVRLPSVGTNFPRIDIAFTENGFMQLTLTMEYRRTAWKQVKMVREEGADRYTVDAAKTRAAAQTLMEIYKETTEGVKRAQVATKEREARQRVEFAALRASLESASIQFVDTNDTGGDILFGSGTYGPRLSVRGNKAVLKFGKYGNDHIPIKNEMIPEVVAVLRKALS